MANKRMGEVADLKLGDLATFLAVRRNGSVTGAARELEVTPSQVSKAIARLEAGLKVRLLSRRARGVALTEDGLRVAPDVEATVARWTGLRRAARAGAESARELTVAAPSYLNAVLLPIIATSRRGLRVRGLELPPALVRAYAGENFVDVALLPSGVERLPSTWSSERVGEFRQGLFATRALAKKLGAQPVAAARVREVPFVMPIFNYSGQFVSVDDDCPLALSERVAGHEAQTMAVALELAARTGQLVFGPVVAARRHIAAGALVEVRVKGWRVTEPVFVSFNGDRVLARDRDSIVVALREALRDLGAGEPSTKAR